MNKKYNLKLDLQFRCNNSIMKFNQFDNNTSDFFMRITNGGNLVDIEKAIVVLAIIKPSGKVASQFVEVENGLVYADLKPNMRDEIGIYTAQAMLILEDERVVTDVISYEVEEDKIFSLLNDTVGTSEEFTLLTDMLSRLSAIEISEEQRVINEAERILSEENRKIEEAKRVEAELIRQHEEADRAKYDATRESNENIRKINEEARISSENVRLENEANRIEQEANRVKAEQLRKDNYNLMTKDEERRRSEANAHREAEVLRVQAENTRVNEEAKRRTTEQARVSAENTRVSNENTRKANETTRQTNETHRVEAETQRQNRYNSFILEAEANANNFENYTNAAKVNEGERKSNELNRKSQEDRRVSNEVERISNENTRKANENARIESEKQRVDAENLRKEKIVEIQSDYDSLKKVIIDENASANLQNQINQTNSQLEHKANYNTVWNMANMGQDVKEAMSGGSVAIVGEDMVLEENIVDGQVKIYKTDLTDFVNLFNGDYRSDCFASNSNISVASGDTVRTAIIELEENCEYEVKTFKNDRFRITLHNSLFEGEKLTGGKGIVYYSDGSINSISFTNTSYKYAYITVSNSSVDCKLYVYKKNQNLNSNIKVSQDNIKEGFLVNYNIIKLSSYRSDYYVDTNGRLIIATGDTARTTYFKLKPNTNYEFEIPYGDRQMVSLTTYEFGGSGKSKYIVDKDGIFEFNSENYQYCHIYVSNSYQEPVITIREKTLVVNGEELKVSSSSNNYINVKDYGATGNGVTNDTETVLKALDIAKQGDGVLYFPNGTYMVDRSIYMSSNMQIIGARGATIKKFPAITQLITQDVEEGQTYVYVEDASKYYVGQDAEIGSDREGSARWATPLLITAIDLDTNKIEFEAYYKTGATQAYSAGGYFTSSFSILRTNGTKEVAENILIQGITLDGNRQDDEPSEWGLSCIHIDPDNRNHHKYKQSDIRIIDVEIYNSPADAISDQSSCDSYISGCTLVNAKRHGVHWGTVFNNAVFDGNTVKDCGLDGVFWCENVSYVRCVNNYIENCNRGCDASAGGTTWGLDSIISNNIFNNMRDYVIYIPTWKGVVVSNNIIKNINNTPIYANNSIHVNISNNILKDFIVEGKSGIYATNADYLTIIGNVIDNPNGKKVTLTGSTNVIELGNGN